MTDPGRPAFGRRASPPEPIEEALEAPEPAYVAEPPEVAQHVSAPMRSYEFEHRGSPRVRTLQSGKLLLEGDTDGIDCTVRDLSIAGAGIRLPSAMDLPQVMRLLMIREGLLFDCVQVWRREERAGLRFTGRHDLRGDPDSAFHAIWALWKQLAAA
jgi:hypothetical protein